VRESARSFHCWFHFESPSCPSGAPCITTNQYPPSSHIPAGLSSTAWPDSGAQASEHTGDGFWLPWRYHDLQRSVAEWRSADYAGTGGITAPWHWFPCVRGDSASRSSLRRDNRGCRGSLGQRGAEDRGTRGSCVLLSRRLTPSRRQRPCNVSRRSLLLAAVTVLLPRSGRRRRASCPC
jgi:hypothetical protein